MKLDGGICLRPFRAADTQAVIALWRELLPSAAPHDEPALSIRRKFEVDDLFFVAAEGTRIVGTVMGGYDGHRGRVYALAVAADRRRQGIGSALVGHLERELARRGCLKVNLQVRAANEAVVAFYKKLGFAVEDRISMGKLIDDGVAEPADPGRST